MSWFYLNSVCGFLENVFALDSPASTSNVMNMPTKRFLGFKRLIKSLLKCPIFPLSFHLQVQEQQRRNGTLKGSGEHQERRQSAYLLLPARCCLTVCRILSFQPAGYNCSCPLPSRCHASVNKDKNCGKKYSTSSGRVFRNFFFRKRKLLYVERSPINNTIVLSNL